MRFAVRASYPEENHAGWEEKIRSFEPVGCVEVAFANPGLFESISLERVVEPVKTSSIDVAAIHMAYARVVEKRQFRQILRRTIDLADELDVRYIIAHPNRGRLSDVLSFLDDEISPLLEKRGKILCWETFESKRRVLHGLEGIVSFCGDRPAFRVCYDFAHTFGMHDQVEDEIIRNLEWIHHFHLSNRVRAGRIQHLPVFWNEEAGEFGRDLDLLALLRRLAEEGYSGSVTLEYMPQFYSHYVPDALKLMEMFNT